MAFWALQEKNSVFITTVISIPKLWFYALSALSQRRQSLRKDLLPKSLFYFIQPLWAKEKIQRKELYEPE